MLGRNKLQNSDPTCSFPPQRLSPDKRRPSRTLSPSSSLLSRNTLSILQHPLTYTTQVSSPPPILSALQAPRTSQLLTSNPTEPRNHGQGTTPSRHCNALHLLTGAYRSALTVSVALAASSSATRKFCCSEQLPRYPAAEADLRPSSIEHGDVDIVAVNDPFIEPKYAVRTPQ